MRAGACRCRHGAPPLGWDAVIFDNDGVLVDSERVANRVLAETLTAIGLPTTTAQSIARYMGRSLVETLERVADDLGHAPPADLAERVRGATLRAFEAGLAPVAGIAGALDAITCPIAVASSAEPERIARSLALAGLGARFDGRVFSAVEVARGKPAPDVYLHAARRLGASPRRCAVVEDTPVGVRAGVAAGMTVFGYADLIDADALAREGAIAFADMAALPALLARHDPGPG